MINVSLFGRAWIGAAAMLIALGVRADDPHSTPAQSTDPETAPVRFLHASPDAPAVDVADADSVIAAGLDYKQATEYIELPVEAMGLRVDALVPGGPETVIGPVDLTLDPEAAYSVVAIGEVAALDALLLEGEASPVGEDRVRAHVVHAAPNAPEVQVYVTDPMAPLDQCAPISTFSFGDSLGPLEIPAGNYRIRVVATQAETTDDGEGAMGDAADADDGADADMSDDGQADAEGDADSGDAAATADATVFDSGEIELPGGADLLIAAVDNTGVGESPISLVVADGQGSFEILDEATPTQFRVVHASPDAPNVDVVVDDNFENPVLTDVPFEAVSDYLEVAPGEYNVKVTAAGNPGVIAIDENLELEAGTQYSVYASGLLASIGAQVLVDDNRSVVTNAKLRLVHEAPSAGRVDIYLTEPGADISAVEPAFSEVDFEQETGYVPVAGGDYDVTVTPAGSTAPAIGPLTVTLENGRVYTAAARDAAGGGPPFGVILLDGFTE